MWKIFELKASRIGRTCSSASSEPPVMRVSVPFSAAAAPPEMPASRYSAPFACELGVQRDRRARVRRAEVDDDLALPRGADDAVVAAHDALDDRRVGQGEEHDVGLPRHVGRASRPGVAPAAVTRSASGSKPTTS